MTSQTAIKTSMKVSTLSALGLAVAVWSVGSYAGEQAKTASGPESATTAQVALGSTQDRFDLRAYGDRFKMAMEATAKEAAKPNWTWISDNEQHAQLSD